MGYVHTRKSECDRTPMGVKLNNKNAFVNLPINR